MKILYIHGFNGKPEGPKLDMLRHNFKKAEIIAPQHDNDARSVYQLLSELVNTLGDYDDLILGSSLGGFWANFFSLKYQLSAVMVNPVISPSATLAQLGYSASRDYLSFEEQIPAMGRSPRTVLLAQDDELLDYRDAQEYYSHQCGVHTYQTGGHRMNTPESLDHIRKAVSSIWIGAICAGITND